MRKFIIYPAALLVIALFATACMNKDLSEAPIESNPNDYFNFSTTMKVDINLSYGTPEGYSFFFEIFDQNPLKQVELEGGMTDIVRDPAIKAVAKGYTDEKGCYSNSITIPAITTKLYVYSTAIGVEKMMNIDIVNDIASAPYVAVADESRVASSRAATKAYFKDEYEYKLNLGAWEDRDSKLDGYKVYGRPTYIYKDNITVSSNTLMAINNAFRDGQPVNKQYFKVTDINITKDANIWLYLIDENTANNNVIGYYTYQTGQKPTSISEIKDRIVAIPNARLFANHTNFPAGKHGAMSRGEGVQLKFYNGSEFKESFPAGVSIGWILSSDGYRFEKMRGKKETLYKGWDYFYSQANLNPETSGEKNHLALFRHEDFVVFGFEDYYNNAGDGDCNDVVFHVKSNPADAITDEIPEVEESEKDPSKEAYTEENEGTLLFEDLWPFKGDYDMNDVVIKYHSVVSYNHRNEAIGTTDTFKLLWSGAQYPNGFAYEMNVNRSNVEVTIENNSGITSPGLSNNLDKTTIILFDNALIGTANNTKQSTYIVKTKFKTPITMGKFEKAPYNPYITINANTLIELHLPGYRPTSNADLKYFGKGDDKSNVEKGIYYVSNLQYPFAIHIIGADELQIKKESRRIDATYPTFDTWVETGGKDCKDWYKHPIKVDKQ